jgi:invasion protein IalB
MKPFFRLTASLAGLVLAGGIAFALPVLAQDAQPQSPPQPQAGAPSTPTDVKPIGDWTVRCFPVTSPSPCDMYEELEDKNSHQRVLGVSIAYDPNADRNIAQIAVPLGISIPAGLSLKTDSYQSPKLPYRRCDRAGCYVELILPNDIIGSLSKSGPDGSINVVADNGKVFSLRFSLNGFSGAHDAMSGLARQKANKGAAAPAPKK